MAFDLEGARNAGYSSAEIADHLAAKSKFKLADARKAGYSDDEIVAHLLGSPTTAPATPDAPEPTAPIASAPPPKSRSKIRTAPSVSCRR